jgi:hypothetical protein
MTAPKNIDKSDQCARRAMWEDFFTRRCPTVRDVINSAVGALVLRDAQIADLEDRVRELSAECKHMQRLREEKPQQLNSIKMKDGFCYCNEAGYYRFLENEE